MDLTPVSVKALDGFKIWIEFNDGVSGEIYRVLLSRFGLSRGRIAACLRVSGLFRMRRWFGVMMTRRIWGFVRMRCIWS